MSINDRSIQHWNDIDFIRQGVITKHQDHEGVYVNGRTDPVNLPRAMVVHMKEEFGDTPLHGVEVGVFYGTNAISILNTLNMDMLYLVDPYIAFPGGDYGRDATKEIEWTRVLHDALRLATFNLHPYTDRSRWIFLPSISASTLLPNELDFVYIDGDHDSRAVLADIEAWLPKVRIGGYIGGHDYAAPRVSAPVSAYTTRHGIKLHTCVDSTQEDWWFKVDKL